MMMNGIVIKVEMSISLEEKKKLASQGAIAQKVWDLFSQLDQVKKNGTGLRSTLAGLNSLCKLSTIRDPKHPGK